MLPLDNLSRDPGEDYFADGMTEALIADLAKIRALKVISRTSAMRYKGSDKPLGDIARELNVEAIVEGSVLKVGQRVRITAQLIHAASDTRLWAESHERDLRDVLTIQSEVARAVTREIRIAVTPEEEARLAKVHAVDPEAHRAYMLGRHFWNRRTRKGFDEAIKRFSEAIDKGPLYAEAYAGLADAYSMLGTYGHVRPREAYPKAKAAATKALEMNDALAEPYASLGWAAFAFDWDWAAAERYYKRAIEFSPGYATAHHWYSVLLAIVGRHDEAGIEIQRALALDPLSPIINTNVGWVLFFAGKFEAAIEQYEASKRVEPAFPVVYERLGVIYVRKGLFEKAIQSYQEEVQLSDRAQYGWACSAMPTPPPAEKAWR